ncbi:MAG: HEAT repeat domain-containing protein [Acidobacteriota bacterium]
MLLVALLSAGVATAQGQAAPGPDTSADGKIVTAADLKPRTKAELIGDAWDLLQGAVTDPKHVDLRIQGLAALGTMGANPRAGKMISAAFEDKDVDVRTAAVLAAGQSRNRALTTGLHKLLDDKEPQVAFAAANTLWRMGDKAGEDILVAVVDGDSKASAGLMHGGMHQASREMHNPAGMAKLGAMEGASLLLGPFGFGVTAYEYVKKNGGDSARVRAVEDVGQGRSPQAKKVLMEALRDKDPGVWAAAALAVRGYREPNVAAELAKLFADSKRPVQLSAAASYLVCVGAVVLPAPVPLMP